MSKFTKIVSITLACLLSANMLYAQSGKWATLKGQFVYEGDAPSMKKIVPTKDQDVCGKHQLYLEDLVVNKENNGIANVIVWIYKPKKVDVHPDYKSSAEDTIKMDNLNCRFEPRAVVVRTGQTLQMGNPDPVAHNSKIDFIRNKGVNPLIPQGGSVDLQFSKPEIIPVKVSCSIHPWMQGIILVQDHPYMAITDKDGKFELKNLPADEKLTLRVWQEKAGYIQEVKIDGGKKTAWKKGQYIVNLSKDEEHKYVVPAKVFDK